MSKTKLLQMMLITGSLVVAGCSSTPTDDSGTTGETEGTDELMPLGEATEEAPSRAAMPEEEPEEPVGMIDPADMIPSQNVVYFAFDSFSLDEETRAILDEHVTYLRFNPEESIVLEGHTDERGSAEYNLALGENRAESAMDYMNLRGVDNSRMYMTSFGESNPVVNESSEEAWSLNRRVEVKYE